ncbi:hypothetical protein [Vibrio cholerae]|uniref:hypothetical protein n=1 Tax=Vibrio cholerae TaxID=666 RepID=UPI0014839D4C|nr:hypothetical protein [Vibrio cholerae]
MNNPYLLELIEGIRSTNALYILKSRMIKKEQFHEVEQITQALKQYALLKAVKRS